MTRDVWLQGGGGGGKQRRSKESAEAGGELEGPLGVRCEQTCLLRNPKEQVDARPEDAIECLIRNSRSVEGLGQQVRSEVDAHVVNFVGPSVAPWGGTSGGEDGSSNLREGGGREARCNLIGEPTGIRVQEWAGGRRCLSNGLP